MPITINGTGTITGISAGGLNDGIITQPELATGVAGTGPAFSAYQSTLQTLATGVATKIQFQTENFDTASCFDNTTNYRFTPNVAGYYQINSTITAVLNVNNQPLFVQIFKNGVNITWGQAMGSTTAYPTVTVSSLIYMNGTTDYVEIYGLHSNPSSVATIAQSEYNSFSASLVRSA